jgi:hypothetical protein
METKLTLKLDQNVINAAKIYAQKNKKSLSRLVEDYFKLISAQTNNPKYPLNPIVKELSGIISEKSIKKSENSYIDYLEKKYE